MHLTKKDIKKTSKNILNFLDEQAINSVEDLSKHIDHNYFFDKNNFISVSLRPSNLGTNAITLSYNTKKVGIPLEVRINSSLGYSQFILKSIETLGGYHSFAIDLFGNTIQNKLLFSYEISLVREEFKRLSSLK